jgi:hypothetical protein
MTYRFIFKKGAENEKCYELIPLYLVFARLYTPFVILISSFILLGLVVL